MLNLKNSLVNLTITLFSVFFLTVLLADDSNFIFPKKKIITINTNKEKPKKIGLRSSFKSIDLPKKNPLRIKSIQQKKLGQDLETPRAADKKIIKDKNTFVNLPKNKPNLKNNKNIEKSYLESETQKKLINSMLKVKKKKTTKF